MIALTCVLIVLVITLLIFCFVCSPAVIYGESMTPSLSDGQVIMISKIHKEPVVGDIIVYKKPTEKNKKVIKRVVGVAGDVFTFSFNSISNTGFLKKATSDFQCHLTHEQYIFLSSKYTTTISPSIYQFTIQQGEVFTIGDNIHNSIDGRNYGPIPTSSIIGIKIK